MKACRQYWRNLKGRCVLNFNWDEIDYDSVVLITASEYRPDDADLSHSARFVGDATIRVRNISPHGPPFDPNHGVTFVVTVDWDTPLDIVTDITLLEVKPQSFGTTRLPYNVQGMDLGASTVLNGRLYMFFGDTPGPDFNKPIGVIPQVTGDSSDLIDLGRYFVPPEYRIQLSGPGFKPESCNFGTTDAKLVRHIGRAQTPTGAFTYDGNCHVFAVFNKCPNDQSPAELVSVLTRSPDPYASGGVFDFVGSLDVSVLAQVAPCLVQNHEFPGLPPSNATDGLIMLGQGGGSAPVDSQSGIFLAWMPLRKGITPNTSEILFFTGRARMPWSPHSQDAEELVHLAYFWSSISVGRISIPGATDKWLLLYQRALGPDEEHDPPQHPAFNSQGIFARIASKPWELAQVEELEIFNPDRDGAWINGLMANRARSYPYGAFLLNPYTRFDPLTRTATIFYLMSTYDHYQAVVMRSRIPVP